MYHVNWVVAVLSSFIISCGGSKNNKRSYDVTTDEIDGKEIPVDKDDPVAKAPFTLSGWTPTAFISTNTAHMHSDSPPTLYVSGTGIGGQIVYVYCKSHRSVI